MPQSLDLHSRPMAPARRVGRSLPALLALAALAALAGCQTRGTDRPLSSEVPPPPRFAEPPPELACNASLVRDALDQPINQGLLEDMRKRSQAASARTTGVGDPPPPNEAQRLLVEVNAQGRVTGARCG